MKRYYVLQDARGYWGIRDTGKCPLSEVFASWGNHAYSGAELLDEIVTWARKLNQGISEKDKFAWGFYEPREDNR